MIPNPYHCNPITVAKNAVGNVSYCRSCQAYHLSVQHLTLHLGEDVMQALCELLNLAQRHPLAQEMSDTEILQESSVAPDLIRH